MDGEERRYFAFPPSIAPRKVCVLPLLKNKPQLVAKSREIFEMILRRYNAEFDSAGAIGRRYRRADEAGTPFCVTIDFETLVDDAVTVRDRDLTRQTRVKILDLMDYLSKMLDN